MPSISSAMSFKEDHERWQDAVAKIQSLRQLTGEVVLMDFNVVLDQLNSLDYSTKIVTRNEEAWQVLSKCCVLIPSDSSNNQLVSKFCLLIINILAKHKIPVNQATLDDLLGFLMLSVQKCQQWVFLEHLHALMAVLNENGAMCEQFAETLIGRTPDGLLVSLCQNSSNDFDTRSSAIRCVGHLCTRTESDESLSEHVIINGLGVLQKILQTPADPRVQVLQHFRLINTVLRALVNVLGACSHNQKSQLSPLLTILKDYMFCGMPGYDLNLSDETKKKEDTSDAGSTPDELSSINVEPVHHKNRSYMFKKKRKRGGVKKDRPHKPHTPFRPGTKYMSHSSMDALTPAFARTTIVVGGVEQSANSATIQEALQPMTPPAYSAGHPSGHSGSYYASGSAVENASQKTPVEQSSDDSSDNLSGSEGYSATSSDSDLSDSEAGQAARMWSLMSKVRQNALACLHLVIKGLSRKELFGYWSLFIPDNSVGNPWSLFTAILKDPVGKVRACAVGVLIELLEGSRPFLAAADDREECNTSTVRPFTSFSAKLGAVVRGLHRCLLQALAAEMSTYPRVQIVKCISALMVNSPYNRLKEGMITKIVTQVKPLLTHQDPALRVAVLTCFGMTVSVHAPLQEVVDLMKPSTYPSLRPCVAPGELKDTSSSVEAPSVEYQSQEPVNTPWLVSHCGRIASRVEEPIAVRVQGLQVLAAFLRNYFNMASRYITWITSLGVSCLKDPDPSLSLHGIKLLEELAKTMYACISDGKENEGVDISSEQLLDFWSKLLQGPLTTALQDSSTTCPKFCSAAVDCLSNIGPQIFEILPMDKRILCITLCLGLSSDEDKYLKGSAIRAVGVLVLYPILRPDVLFVADSANSILSCMQDTALAVRIKAAWALGNLSDTLVHNKLSEVSTFMEDFSDMLLLKLLDCAITACDDRDKVKSNGVRAVGNFLRYVGSSSLQKRGFTSSVEKAVQALARNAGSGLMKVRWNACYAIGNVFRNAALPVGTADWTGGLFKALENVIKECKNFKVRINAVLAVSIPRERRCYGDVKQYCSTWETLAAALLGTETLADFADFKYRDTLREQLSFTLYHMLNFVTPEDVVQLSSVLELHGQALKHLVTSYTCKVSAQREDGLHSESSEQSSIDKLQVVQAAKKRIRDNLDQGVPAVQCLAAVFSSNVEESGHYVRREVRMPCRRGPQNVSSADESMT